MKDFDHERLDVYQASLKFVILADQIIGKLPKGRSYLSNQLRRAALSISLNIAEGAGEFSPPDKARFYRIARRSATECAAVLDICRCLKLAEITLLVDGRKILLRIVAMLTRMIKIQINSGSGSQTGSGSFSKN